MLLLLLVELDTQRGLPGLYDGLRMTANLVSSDGELATPEMIQQVGIGSRLRIIYKDINEQISIPLFTLDEQAEQPENPWRYPIE